MSALPVINTFGLLLQMREALTPALEQLALPLAPASGQAGSKLAPAAIHIGNLPARTAGSEPTPPFVVLQAMSGKDADNLHEVTVLIRLCLYAGQDPEAGEAALHALISAIRLALLSLPGLTLPDGAWRMEGEHGLPWERPDQQGSPYLEAYLTSVWQTRGARETSQVHDFQG